MESKIKDYVDKPQGLYMCPNGKNIIELVPIVNSRVCESYNIIFDKHTLQIDGDVGYVLDILIGDWIFLGGSLWQRKN